MMQQWPYGANILIKSIACNFNENIALGGADFLTSTVKDTEMTFEFTELNGELVTIETNLTFSNLVRNATTKKGTFKLSTVNSNCSVSKGADREKPYINLCCNNVKIPISFIDSDGHGNKWGETTISENNIEIRDYDGNYVYIPKEITLSWNRTSNNQKIFIERVNGSSAEYYACEVQYLYLNDENEVVEGQTRIWTSSTIPKEQKRTITLPKLNGTSSVLQYGDTKLTLKFYKYLSLGVEIRLSDGCTTYKHNTVYYIKGTNRSYNNTAIPNMIKGTYYLESSPKGFPKLELATDLKTKWNSDFFFITQLSKTSKKKYYISPSTSQVLYTFDLLSTCDIYCPCDANYDCEGYCQCEEVVISGCEDWSIRECEENCFCDTYSYMYNGEYHNYTCSGYCTCNWNEYCGVNASYCTEDTQICPCDYYAGELYVNGDCGEYCTCNDYRGSCNHNVCGWYCDHEDCGDDTYTRDCSNTYPGCTANTVTTPIWDAEKKYVGRVGGTNEAIAVYDIPGKGRERIASLPKNSTFTVLYVWEGHGWFETYDGWISSSGNWWIN